MKKIKLLIPGCFLLLIPGLSRGQQVDVSSNENYVKVTTYTGASKSASQSDVTYYDGLGDPVQVINIHASPQTGTGGTKKNIVTPIRYDPVRRSDVQTFLPYTSHNANGTIETSPFDAQNQFYSAKYSDENAFAEQEYEASPLNRIRKRYNVGSAYRQAEGKATTFAYEANLANECPKFTVVGDSEGTSLSLSGFYDAGTLSKTVTTNEDGATAASYTNLQGQTIIEVGTDGIAEVKTCYVYDDSGNLCYVLPPELSAGIESGLITDLSDTGTEMKQFAYIYKYDALNRCVEKKLPGADWVWMIYDKADHLILCRDGNLWEQNRWIYNVYDDLGRLVRTNLIRILSAPTREDLQIAIDDIAYSKSYPASADIWRLEVPLNNGYFTHIATLTESRYGGYEYMPSSEIPEKLAYQPRNINHTYIGNVLITEMMYDSPLRHTVVPNDNTHEGEFVELYNAGPTEIDISGWKLKRSNGGGMYDFPTGTIIPSGEYVIVAYRNPESEFTLEQLYTGIDTSKPIFYQSSVNFGDPRSTVRLWDPVTGWSEEEFEMCSIVELTTASGERMDEICYGLGPMTTDITQSVKGGLISFPAPYSPRSLKRNLANYTPGGSAIFDNSDWAVSAPSPFEIGFASLSVPTIEMDKSDDRNKGLLTYEKVAILDGEEVTDKFVERAFYYDYKGRVVQTVESNHLGTISCYHTDYDFVGNVLKSMESHGERTMSDDYEPLVRGKYLLKTDLINLGGEPIIQPQDPSNRYFDTDGNIYERYRIPQRPIGGMVLSGMSHYYIPEDCLEIVERTIEASVKSCIGIVTSCNGEGVPLHYLGSPPYDVFIGDKKLTEFTYDHRGRLLSETTTLNDGTPAVVNYGYDELGKLASKTYGAGENAITETYDYNIQGWLTEKKSDVFDMRLRYYDPQQTDTQANYTGNITEWEWKHKGTGADSSANTYAFTYDKLSRLTDSQLFQFSDDQWQRSGSFEEWLGAGDVDAYDKNGNILSLMRSSSTGDIADGFRYEYNGNQLAKLYPDWDDDSNYVTYAYDANGNCTTDGPNNLDLTYNYLNLIGNVSQDNATLANYVYLVDGTKVSATNSSGDGLVYIGSLVYSKQGDNLSLESTGFSGGRLVATSNDYEVRYFLTDHLGSTRAVVNSAGVVLERNDFMPFGLAWADADRPVSDNRYLYNGKEEQEFVDVPYTDFGWRMYDPKYRLSWNGVDPFAEAYENWSPYNYILNCPISYFDFSGLWPTKIHNRMIIETFSGLLSSSDMNILMRASKMADAGEYQGVADSHRHAMGQKGLSRADSEAAYNNFINDQYNLYLNTQDRARALEHLGMALHAIMDWSSPTHHGFQVWKGFFHEKGFGLSHFLGEQMKAYLDPANQTKINASKEAMLNLLMKALEAKGEIIILPEITIIGSKLSKSDRQNLMDNMLWQSVTPNSFGNTGLYNKPGRTSDQYYSDEFLKWYYGE